jgi:hypothetical protein
MRGTNHYTRTVDRRATRQTDPEPFWSPLALKPTLWLRSDKGITLNASAVSAWADQSGTGNNYSQGTGAKQPTFVPVALNGLPALRFDDVEDGLVADVGPNINARPFTVAVVWTPNAQAGAFQRTLSGATNNWLIGKWSGYSAQFSGTGFVSDTVQLAPNGAALLSICTGVTGATAYFSNGADITQTSTHVGDPGILAIGARPVVQNVASCDTYEVVVAGQMSSSDRLALQAYVRTRYGIAGIAS